MNFGFLDLKCVRYFGLFLVCFSSFSISLAADSVKTKPIEKNESPSSSGELDPNSDAWKVSFLEKKAMVEDFFEKWARKLEPASEANISYHMSVNFEIDEEALSKAVMTKSQGIKFQLLAAEMDSRFLPEQRLQSMTPQAFVSFVKASKVTLNVYSTSPTDEAWAQRFADVLRTSFQRTVGKRVEVKVVKGASIDNVTEKMRQKITDLEMSLGDARRERDEIRRSKESKSFNENQFVQQLQLEKQRNDSLVQKNETLDRERESLKKSLQETTQTVSDLREEMSVYKTPLGEVKRIVKGLELPLTILPFALIAIFLGVGGLFVFTLISTKRNSALQAGLLSLGDALQNGLKSSQKVKAEGAKISKIQGNVDVQGRDRSARDSGSTRIGSELTKEELDERVQRVCEVPLALAACIELVAEQGNVEKVLTLLHAMPSEVKASLLNVPSIDECFLKSHELVEFDVSKPAIHAALVSLENDLFREFGKRLLFVKKFLDVDLNVRAREAAFSAVVMANVDSKILFPLLALLPKTRISQILENAIEHGHAQAVVETLLEIENPRFDWKAFESSPQVFVKSNSETASHLKRLGSWLLTQPTAVREAIQSFSIGVGSSDLSALQHSLSQRVLTVAQLMTLPDSYFADLLESYETEELVCFLSALSSSHRQRLVSLLARQTQETVKSEMTLLKSSPLKQQQAFDAGAGLLDGLLINSLELYKKYTSSKMESSKLSA
jgi:hypothetical protein